jgi:NADH-quinone oxidoreductase subunit N
MVMDYSFLFRNLSPEIVLTITALVTLTLDLTVMKESPRIYRSTVAAGLLAIGVLGAVICLHFFVETVDFVASNADKPVGFAAGMFIHSPLNMFVKKAILFLALMTGLLATEVRFTRDVGEYFALITFSTIGMMLLVSTENLLMLFVALELTSLCLYVLTAYDEKSKASAEAGMKYFLFGGMSAAFLLFGISYLYGLTGTLEFTPMASALSDQGGDPLLNIALIMVVIGFGFKLAAVPFHFWAPDVYQAAPIASAMFIGSASKVASIYAFAKLLLIGFGSWAWGQGGESVVIGWAPMLVLMAVLSMVFGNLAALAQTSIRRLIAYSAIAHSGYLLVGLLAEPTDAYRSLLYYAITYALTTVGLFGVVAALQGKGEDLKIKDFAGFSKRSPLLAACLFIFVLSLAGIPPLAGFFGKFYLFAAALKSDPGSMQLLALVVIGIAMSAVSLYYYLQLLKQAFVVEAKGSVLRIKSGFIGQWVIVLLAASVVLLGCFPDLILDRLTAAIVSAVW